MGKKPVRRRQASPWSGEGRQDSLDSMFGGMAGATQAKLSFESTIVKGMEAMEETVGLPLPSLAPRYLLQNTVFPLGRNSRFVGVPGTCKTAALDELMRWHMLYGGGAFFMENEQKDSADLRAAILQYSQTWLNRFMKLRTRFLEEWQEGFLRHLDVVKTACDSKGGPGRTVPYIFGLDSLTATAPKNRSLKTQKEGHASLGYADIANLVSRYMSETVGLWSDYPFTFAMTNHLKPGTDSMGRPDPKIAGGKAPEFMETYQIEMSRLGDIDLESNGGIRLQMKTRKNSLGPSRKFIHVNFIWWWAKVDGQWRQEMAWDWNTAAIETILMFENIKGKKGMYKDLADVCGFTDVKRKLGLISSRTLGIPDLVPFREAGIALESNQDVLRQLYPIMGIKEGYPFQPAMDYRAQLSDMRRAGEITMRTLYHQAESMPVIATESLDPEATTRELEEESAEDPPA